MTGSAGRADHGGYHLWRRVKGRAEKQGFHLVFGSGECQFSGFGVWRLAFVRLAARMALTTWLFFEGWFGWRAYA
ncbi:MAG: hypothetical protein JKY34_05840 [Kordiimonadaceae bacterium]|nr:hypothetical protein [Kordiimonadaceae bacterium]